MGGSGSKSQSSSDANTSQDVWGPQGDALGGMYGQAGDLWGQNSGYQNQLNSLAQSLGPQLQQIFGGAQGGFNQQLGGGSFGDTSDVREKLMGSMGQPSQMGQMYNSIVGGEGNDYIDPMVAQMKQGAMQNLGQMQSGTGLDAAAMGQGGSSRHAMQNAMQGAQVNKDMMTQEANMRGGAYDKDLAMKMGIAQQADQSRQSEQDRMMQMMQGSDQNRMGGMNYGSSMQNLGMGMMAPWMQAQNQGWGSMGNYANTLGGPTVLSYGNQSGNSKGMAGGGGSGKQS